MPRCSWCVHNEMWPFLEYSIRRMEGQCADVSGWTHVVLSAMYFCQSLHVNESCTFRYISISCSLSQYKMVLLHRDWEYLACQQTDRIIALYWGPVILGCLIRNSTEFSYLEEEERRPWGKLRLWQGFITAITSIYIGFVPACMHYLTNKNTCTLF